MPTRKGQGRNIAVYEHDREQRLNNPPVGLVNSDTDPEGTAKQYAYDPHLDPQLVWAGKAERTSFEVPTVSLHVHERIEARTIIEAVRKKTDVSRQLGFFAREEENPPIRHAIDFYKHPHGWSNRLIAGDSLLVMNSLLEKEGMAGKVQMIYIDPPYGIKYGSNFQPFVNKRDVKDGKDEDLTAEPEQIRAFRDTWELGIHSYLAYLRDRLLLARELMSESGSIFVQISDENVHRVRCLMDEVFGAGNFVSLIAYIKTSGLAQTNLPTTFDVLIWYARDKSKVKYRQLYRDKNIPELPSYSHIQLKDQTIRKITPEEKSGMKPRPEGSRVFAPSNTTSQGNPSIPLELNGIVFTTPPNRGWKTSTKGMQILWNTGRLMVSGCTLNYKRYVDDFPVTTLTNLWDDIPMGLGFGDKMYVVQTSLVAIQRCLLMTTDPGDLVLDPTCGSGTTAFVAEQWGRRWITCDTSRVALTLARQRLMTAVFDYYELAHLKEGVGSGFRYRSVPHVTLKSIANNPDIDSTYTRLHPAVEQALADLNAALKGRPLRLRIVEGGRAGQWVDFAAPDTAATHLPTGQQVNVNELLEWEVPSEFPSVWPKEMGPVLERYHQARRTLQKEMDHAIARHASQETLYDQPFVDRNKTRVSGPFTVEAVPAPVVRSIEDVLGASPYSGEQVADASIARSGETLRQGQWRDELLRTGIRAKAGQYIHFTRLEPLPGCTFLHADGQTRPGEPGSGQPREDGPTLTSQRVVVSFGPEHAPLEQRQVERALAEADTLVPKPKLIVFAAFQFDPEAAKDIDQTKWPGVILLKAQMNADLLTHDLKKQRASNESFWLIGQPEVQVTPITQGADQGKYRVSVHGFDYYNPRTGGIESGGADKIAIWLLDLDYDGRSLYPRQVFFPMADDDGGWTRLARSLRAELDEELLEAYRGTESLPFKLGEHKRIAVKVVDDRGVESLKVLEVR
jgi:adenine-specific DNA-methyltransferase